MNLIDTDVLIWYMKGNAKAKALINQQDGFCISAVTFMELVQGMRNKAELQALRNAIHRWDATVINLNEAISAKAMFYVEQNYLSHSVSLADALIGATAVVTGMPLLTANTKHYTPINEIELKAFRP